jgi:hypothetical protein
VFWWAARETGPFVVSERGSGVRERSGRRDGGRVQCGAQRPIISRGAWRETATHRRSRLVRAPSAIREYRSESRAMDPSSPHVDPVTAAGEVSLRFDRWFASRELDLPPETRAQFVEMGMEALQRWPDRSSGDVLDELIAELDGRLATIAEEQTSQPAAATRPARGLGRFFRRGDRRH